MKALAIGLMMWLQANCNVPGVSPEHNFCNMNYNIPPPNIVLLSHRDLISEFDNDFPSTNGGVKAFYRYSTKTIFLIKGRDYKNNVVANTLLFHELMHYIHHMNGIGNNGCLAHVEISAYLGMVHRYSKRYKLHSDASPQINYYKRKSCNTMY